MPSHKQSKVRGRRNRRNKFVFRRHTACPRNAWCGNIYVWLDRCAFLGIASKAKAHALHAIKIVVAADEHRQFRVRRQGSEQWKYYQAAVIPPDLLHEFDGMGNRLGLFYVIAESAEGQHILEAYDKEKVCAISPDTIEGVLPHMRDALRVDQPSKDKAGDLWDVMVGTLAPWISVSPSFEEHVQKALDYMWGLLQSKFGPQHRLTIEEVAQVVHWSYSHFRHRFSEELEVTFTTYLISLLFLAAMWRDPVANRLSDIAADVGFYDGPHLYRTFKELLGLSKPELFRHCELVLCFRPFLDNRTGLNPV
ncbi:MAG TPA: helix-turn-helix domain-containing protein [Nitrososphaera sp.]|nr:helix-turn-helix domain-containing protein [Nitrososphaera sp.]